MKSSKAKHRSAYRRVTLVFLALAMVTAGAAFLLKFSLRQSTSGPVQAPASFSILTAMSGAELAGCDIALLNLLCTEGLPSAESVSPEPLLAQLDSWASRIRTETERHFYRYRANPAEYENSESFFRLLMMAVVVQEDFKVRYNPVRANAAEGGLNDGFFKDSRDVFLHGLLTGERVGTCRLHGIPAQAGAGAENSTGCPFNGCLKPMRQECRQSGAASVESVCTAPLTRFA
jgi:hypothetical protein